MVHNKSYLWSYGLIIYHLIEIYPIFYFLCRNNDLICIDGAGLSSSHKHVASSCHSHPRHNFSNTQSLSSNCVNLFLRRVLSENDVCVGAGTVNDEHQLFPIFLADTTTYILLFHLITWVYNIHLQIIVVGNSFGCGISWRFVLFDVASHIIARAVAT